MYWEIIELQDYNSIANPWLSSIKMWPSKVHRTTYLWHALALKQMSHDLCFSNTSCIYFSDSRAKGWRLFIILSAYLQCSDVLRPYLVRYLQTISNDPKREFHGKLFHSWATQILCMYFTAEYLHWNRTQLRLEPHVWYILFSQVRLPRLKWTC